VNRTPRPSSSRARVEPAAGRRARGLVVHFPLMADTLFTAATAGDEGVVGKLITAGLTAAEVNQTRPHGATALCAAAQHGHEAVVGQLLAAGADLDMVMSNGGTCAPSPVNCMRTCRRLVAHARQAPGAASREKRAHLTAPACARPPARSDGRADRAPLGLQRGRWCAACSRDPAASGARRPQHTQLLRFDTSALRVLRRAPRVCACVARQWG
jgi:hypothetical protein